MRCASYCVADSFNISLLVEKLIENGCEPKYFDEVVYVRKSVDSLNNVDIFYFPFGAIVIWGVPEHQEKIILQEVQACTVGFLASPPSDIIYYRIDEKAERTFIDEEINEIILKEDNEFIKLSIAHALAQSVKLNILENSVSELLQKTAPIQHELARTGSVSLSKKEISKQIGILFNERYYINLHSDILDTPEFFWRRPRYEPLYLMTAAFQDIQLRHNILNHRLDMIQELYNILSNELNYKHSTRLEIIIIILIAIEVLLGISNHNLFDKLLNLF